MHDLIEDPIDYEDRAAAIAECNPIAMDEATDIDRHADEGGEHAEFDRILAVWFREQAAVNEYVALRAM